MKERIVIIGDSLGMPRIEDNIKYEDTYAHLLYRKGYEVISRCKRANTSYQQKKNSRLKEDIQELDPDIVLIHLGIVDCAPRLFSRLDTKLLKIFPKPVRSLIIKFFSKHRYFFTKHRKITYVSKKKFSKSLDILLEHAQQNRYRTIFFPILKTSAENESRSYGFAQNIEDYNEIIVQKCKLFDVKIIDLNEFTEPYLLDDGIHINQAMHKYISEKVYAHLN